MIWGWPGPVDFDHPSLLCQKLARGDLDVALVSSLEYLRHPIYRIVDGVSIAARQTVYSVVVAHRVPLEQINSIELDPASETSVALLDLLLQEKKLKPEITRTEAVPSDPAQAKLLIGDQAIRFRKRYGNEFGYWDLAQAWIDLTTLPFVFALWLIRPEIKGAPDIAADLRQILRRNLHNVDQLVAAQDQVSQDFCRRYYTEHLCFELGDREKSGVLEFHRRCLRHSMAVARKLKLEFV